MLILVGVDSDDQLNTTTTFMTDDSCHFYLPEDCAPGQVSGQDCDGAWGQAPIRSLLALPRALLAPPRIESTDQAEGMMPVSERVRPEPRWPGIHHRSLRKSDLATGMSSGVHSKRHQLGRCRYAASTDMGREQMRMLPPRLDELLPLDHPARFVAEFVDVLDRGAWAELGVAIESDSLGAPAYHPRALLSVWLYGFMTGVRSCRKLEAACRDQIPYLWLTGWQHPDHNTLWRFYRGHRQAMRKLFEQTVRTAVAMELVDLAVQAVDGTKVVANASVNRSYDAEGLRGLLGRLDKAIDDLEAQNRSGRRRCRCPSARGVGRQGGLEREGEAGDVRP